MRVVLLGLDPVLEEGAGFFSRKKIGLRFFFHALVFDDGEGGPEFTNSTDRSGGMVSFNCLVYTEMMSDWGLPSTNLVGCGGPGSRIISLCSWEMLSAMNFGKVMSRNSTAWSSFSDSTTKRARPRDRKEVTVSSTRMKILVELIIERSVSERESSNNGRSRPPLLKPSTRMAVVDLRKSCCAWID